MRIPMYVEASMLKVLVLGGGGEAEKKTRRFLEHGSKLTVYSLKFTEWLKDAGERGLIRIIEGDVKDEKNLLNLIREHDLVIYTIPELPRIEKLVHDRCIHERKLFILTTNADETMVAMPVEVHVDGLRVAVTSEGKSTLVAKWVADQIRESLDGRRDIEMMLEAMWYAKRLMKEVGLDYRTRMPLYHRLFSDGDLWKAVEAGDLDGAKLVIEKVVHSAGRR